LRLFEDRALGRMFGPQRDEMTEGWEKLHDEELRKLHPFPNIIRMVK
jgi:hypothetical protein